jgi:hypothetical protein
LRYNRVSKEQSLHAYEIDIDPILRELARKGRIRIDAGNMISLKSR